MSDINYIPAGFQNIAVYLNIRNAQAAIEFYTKAFGAVETGRITMPGNKIAHAELKIGATTIMLAEEMPDWGNKSPLSLGGSPVGLCLYVPDVDQVFSRALDAGAKVDGEMVVKDQFYGDRTGTLIDPFGHRWTIGTHKEDVSFAEMQRRADAMFSPQAGAAQ